MLVQKIVLYKVIANQSPSYLLSLFIGINAAHSTWSFENIPLLSAKYNFFLNTFSPSVDKGWDKYSKLRLYYYIQKTD